VTKNDTVFVLGDLSLQGTRAITEALGWMSSRNGRKVFVVGNHDGCHPGIERKEAGKWMRRYMDRAVRV